MATVLDSGQGAAPSWPIESPMVDRHGPAKPPEERKVGGSTPAPATPFFTCANVRSVVSLLIVTLPVSFSLILFQADDRREARARNQRSWRNRG